MSVILPRNYGYAAAEPFFLDAGATVRSPLSMAGQRINRLGSRFGLSASFPPLRSDDDARALVAVLIAAQAEGLIAHWPQVDFDTGIPGAPLVNGADQLGSSLVIDGAMPNYRFRHGQFGNFTAGGVLHLFQITAFTTTSTGAATLPLQPMIRKSPADNSALDFSTVRIEGWVEDDRRSWTVDRARTVGLSFTVIEK